MYSNFCNHGNVSNSIFLIMLEIFFIILQYLSILIGFLIILNAFKNFSLFIYIKFIRNGKNHNRIYGENSWAIITGASRGIGKAFSQELAAKGFNLFLLISINKAYYLLRKRSNNATQQSALESLKQIYLLLKKKLFRIFL